MPNAPMPLRREPQPHLSAHEQLSDADRRGAARHPAASLPWIKAISVADIKDANLVNVSSTGALVRCRARLLPGQDAVLQLVGASNRFRVKGHVVRCEVADLERGSALQYEVALAFEPDPCPLPVSQHLSDAWV